MKEYEVHIRFNAHDVMKVCAENEEAAKTRAERIFKRFADNFITNSTIEEITAYECEQICSTEDTTK